MGYLPFDIDALVDRIRRTTAFVRANWQVLSLASGTALLALALAAWQGPLKQRYRSQLEYSIRLAREYVDTGRSWEVPELLGPLQSQVWRIPSRAGEYALLLGRSYSTMSDESDEPEASQYRDAALVYLREAGVLGVPVRDALVLDELLGQAYFSHGDYGQSIDAYSDAVALRRRLRAVALRKQVEAELDRPDPNRDEIANLVRSWRNVPELARRDRDPAETAARLFAEGDLDRLRTMLRNDELGRITDQENPSLFAVELRSTLFLNQDGPEAALEYLRQVIRVNDDQISRLLNALTEASVRKPRPDYRAAVRYSTYRLTIPDRSENEIVQIQRALAEYHLALGEVAQARALLRVIDRSGEFATQAQFLLARTFFDEARGIEQQTTQSWLIDHPRVRRIADWAAQKTRSQGASTSAGQVWRYLASRLFDPSFAKRWDANIAYRKAIDVFTDVLDRYQDADRRFAGESLMMLADSYNALGNRAKAIALYDRVIGEFPKSDLERSSRFLKATVMLGSRQPGAIEQLRLAVAQLPAQSSFSSPLLPLSRIREALELAWHERINALDPASAMEIAQIYGPYALPGVAERMTGDAARARAEQLVRESNQSGDRSAEKELAFQLFRDAGSAFRQVAKERMDSVQYGDFLWQSALNYFEGKDFPAALEVLPEFIRVHGGAERDFLAHLLMARANMALRQFVPAAELLESALRKGLRSPNRFEGRLRLARCYAELAHEMPVDGSAEAAKRSAFLARAESLLRRNLDGLESDLDPTASEWRQSLFQLGDLLLQVPRYDEAIARLREAVRRYPSDPETLPARYHIADAYFLSAKAPAERLKSDLAPRQRAQLIADKHRRLNRAALEFQSVVNELVSREESATFPPSARTTLRKSQFRLGDCYFELEDWPRAIEAYSTAANRYQNEPICLVAYVQVALAYWRMNRDAEARSTLRQAQWVMGQLPENVFEGEMINKRQWTDRLNALIGGI